MGVVSDISDLLHLDLVKNEVAVGFYILLYYCTLGVLNGQLCTSHCSESVKVHTNSFNMYRSSRPTYTHT